MSELAFWNDADEAGVTTETRQTTPTSWQQDTWYFFELSRSGSTYSVRVNNVDQNLDPTDVAVELSTTGSTNGDWGIYSYSQADNSFWNLRNCASDIKAFYYQLVVEDSDSDDLVYSLNQAPLGMSISQTGTVTWPSPIQGTYQVTIRVEDNQGGHAVQHLNLVVL